jgi:hypothetical protein
LPFFFQLLTIGFRMSRSGGVRQGQIRDSLMAWRESGCCSNTGISDILEDLEGSASLSIADQYILGSAALVREENFYEIAR